MSDEVVKIALGGRASDRCVLVDAADANAVACYRWSLAANGYAVRKSNGQVVYLHRELMGLAVDDPTTVDHINRDRLDNRRTNLRLVPAAAQAQNVSAHRDGSSRYRGVTRRGARWIAQVGSAGGTVYLGTFEREQDAAEAAAAYRREHLPYSVEQGPVGDPSRRRPEQKRMAPATAQAIRIARATTTLSYRTIADMFGVSAGVVQAVLAGRTFRAPR